MAVSWDGALALVSNRNANTLSVVDTAAFTATTVPLGAGSGPMGLAMVGPNTAYVVLRGNNAIAVVDTTTLTVTQVITGLVGPHGVAYASATRRAYVVNQDAGSVSMLDTATHQLLATWPILGADWVSNISVSTSGQQLYISDAEQGRVYVLHALTGALLATHVPTGDGWNAWDVEALPAFAGPLVYTTMPSDGWVGVLNTATQTIEKILPVGQNGDLRGLALFPEVVIRQIFLPLVRR